MNKLTLHGISNIAILYTGIGIGFLNTILKAKVLTVEEIGVISIITTIAMLAVYFINLGVPSGLKKYYGAYRDRISNKTGLVLISFGLPSVVCIVMSGLFLLFKQRVIHYFNNPLLSYYINYIYLFFLGNMFIEVFRAVFQSEFKSVQANLIYDSVWRVLNLIFLVLLLLIDIAFYYYFIFIITGLFLRVVLFVSVFLTKVQIGRPSLKEFNIDFFKRFSVYSFFMFFAGMAGLITNSVDKIMIGHYISVGAVGIYTIASTFAVLIRTIGKGFSHIAHPLISEYWIKGATDSIKRVYRENVNVQLLIGIYVFIVLFVFSSPILKYLGKDYVKGEGVLIMLAFGELINLATGMCGGIIAYSKDYRFDFLLRFLLVIASIALNLIFIPRWGLNGAAFATALSLALYNIIKLIFVRIRFRMQPYSIESLKILVLGISTGVCLYFVNLKLFHITGIGMSIFISIAFFSLYTGAGLIIFRINSIEKGILKIKKMITKMT